MFRALFTASASMRWCRAHVPVWRRESIFPLFDTDLLSLLTSL